MVEIVGHKLMTHHSVIEPVSITEPGTEIYDAETGAQRPPYRLAETNPEARRECEKPPFWRNKRKDVHNQLVPNSSTEDHLLRGLWGDSMRRW